MTKHIIPFFVVDRLASLRIIKGSGIENYSIKVGLMGHANTSKNFQQKFKNFPCSDDDFCDVVNKKCPYQQNIQECYSGSKIREQTITVVS